MVETVYVPFFPLKTLNFMQVWEIIDKDLPGKFYNTFFSPLLNIGSLPYWPITIRNHFKHWCIMKTSILTMGTMFEIYIKNWLISIRIIREHTKVHFEILFSLDFILFIINYILHFKLRRMHFFSSLKNCKDEYKNMKANSISHG